MVADNLTECRVKVDSPKAIRRPVKDQTENRLKEVPVGTDRNRLKEVPVETDRNRRQDLKIINTSNYEDVA